MTQTPRMLKASNLPIGGERNAAILEEGCALELETIELKRQLAEAQRDAERYRWIADNYDNFMAIQKENSGVEIEAAIDQAIQEQKK